MLDKDVVAGMKVVPHSKSILTGLDNSIVWNIAKKRSQEYLFVFEFDKDVQGWALGSNVNNERKADFFLASDFEPYVEEITPNEEIKPTKKKKVKVRNNKVKQFVYDSVRQPFTEYNTVTKELKQNSFTIPKKSELVIFNDRAIIVILDDGSKGVAKCMSDDEYNETKGIKIAYLRAKIKSLTKELKELIK